MKLYGGSSGRKKKKASDKFRDRSYDETLVSGNPDDDEESIERTPEEKRKIEELVYRYQKYKRRKRILIFSFILVLAAIGAIFWKTNIKPPVVNPTPSPSQTIGTTPAPTPSGPSRKDGFYTFLVLGKDVEAGLTDTILIGSFDTAKNTINVVSIPRDTLLNVPRSYKKANGIYSHNSNDIEKAKADVKTLLGFNVDMYAVVDIKAFQRIVDAIGGVYFDVPVNMDYDDDIQGFNVHLMAGPQQLNGEQALGVVRFRQNNEGSPYGPGYPRADIDRIATQQSFMKTVAKQCLTLWNATKVNEFAHIFEEYVETNLTAGNMVWFGLQFLEVKSENIDFLTMPGDYEDYELGASCVTINLDEWLNILNTKLSPYKEEITKEQLNVLTLDKEGNLYSTSGVVLAD